MGTSIEASLNVTRVIAPTGVAATDTANIQNAHDALPAGGGEIVLGAGVFVVTGGSITLSKPVRLYGMGCSGGPSSTAAGYTDTSVTTIQCASATANALTVTGNAVQLRDFALANTSGSAPTAGAGIGVTAGGAGMRYRSVTVGGFYRAVDHASGFEWFMSECTLYDFVKTGLRISNPSLPDAGDMGISNCQFIAGPNNAAPQSAVEWLSGGGLRMTGNKINKRGSGAFTLGLYLHPADGISTSVFTISGNSFEGMSYGIYADDTGNTGSGTISKIAINGNEFLCATKCISFARTSAGHVSDVVISGNVFTSSSSPSASVDLAKMDNVYVGSNVYGSTITTTLTKGTSLTNLRTVAAVKSGGTNATVGSLTLTGATPVVVTTTAVTAASLIFFSQQATGGTQSGLAFDTTRTPGTSFSVASAAGDTSTVGWMLVEPV